MLFGNDNFAFDEAVLNHYDQTSDLNTGDLDQDSFTDILVSFVTDPTTLRGGIDAYYGRGSKTFRLSHAVAPSADFEAPGSMVAADVNGEGVNDIVKGTHSVEVKAFDAGGRQVSDTRTIQVD